MVAHLNIEKIIDPKRNSGFGHFLNNNGKKFEFYEILKQMT